MSLSIPLWHMLLQLFVSLKSLEMFLKHAATSWNSQNDWNLNLLLILKILAPNFLKHAFETFETRIHTPSALQPNSMMPIHPHGGATCSIIWQGNPISTVKTFATPKLRPVCKRKNWNSQTIQIQPATFCQLLQRNLWCWHDTHGPHFHRCAKLTTPSTDESINDKRVSPTQEVATDFTMFNVCLADV